MGEPALVRFSGERLSDEDFLTGCLELAREAPETFTRAAVTRLYRIAGHPLSGEKLPEHMTLRLPIVEPLVRMARSRVR